MIEFYHGTDFSIVKIRAEERLTELLKKDPKTSAIRFNAENWNQAAFDEVVKSQGLFGDRYIIFLDRVFENGEAKEFIFKILIELKGSQHFFVFVEGKLDKSTLGKIEKQAEKVETFSASEKKIKAEKFNIFSMAFALEQKDKRKLWLLYQTARKNAAPEEIHGILWWKVKQMMLSNRSVKYSASDLRKIAHKMVSIYHDAHRGLIDFDLALEKFLLEI